MNNVTEIGKKADVAMTPPKILIIVIRRVGNSGEGTYMVCHPKVKLSDSQRVQIAEAIQRIDGVTDVKGAISPNSLSVHYKRSPTQWENVEEPSIMMMANHLFGLYPEHGNVFVYGAKPEVMEILRETS